jgi:Tfp pilus assembly protein PilF
MEEIMAKVYVVVFMLFVAPLLQSCSSSPTTPALYDVQALMSVRNSNESPRAYYQLGRYHQARNQLDAAATAYQKALSLDDGYYEAKNALGVIYSMQGKLDLAIEFFCSALVQAPRSAHLHNNLGHAYYLQHKYQEAIDSLEAAAALEPHNQRTLHNLGLAYAGAGLPEKSAQTLRARDVLAVSSELGEPGATARGQLGATPSAANERVPAVASAGDVFSRALPVSPSTSSSTATRALEVGNSAAESIVHRSDADATLVLVNANVYELRTPKLPAHKQSVSSSAAPRQLIAHAERLFRLEVSNGNAIPGMARKVGEQFKRSGINVDRLTNQVPYRQAITEIQYRDGYVSEAVKVASLLQHQVIVVHAKALRPDIHVRLVLGKDVPDHVALFKLESINDQRPMTVAARPL